MEEGTINLWAWPEEKLLSPAYGLEPVTRVLGPLVVSAELQCKVFRGWPDWDRRHLYPGSVLWQRLHWGLETLYEHNLSALHRDSTLRLASVSIPTFDGSRRADVTYRT
jgi:hypothetical protein